MKQRFNIAVISGLALASFCACSDKTTQSDKLITVQIEKSFEAADFDNISSKIEVVETFQPEFTDSTMFSLPTLLAIAGGKAYIHDGKWNAVFDYPSGRLVEAFNHYGPGPEEYMRSYYGYYQPATSEWTIIDDNDWNHPMFKQYTAEGKYIRAVENDSVQSLCPTADGGWLGFNSFMSFKGDYQVVRDRKVYQYSSNWQLDYIYPLKERRWGAEGTSLMEAVNSYDGSDYVVDSDTIYRIDTKLHKLTPCIALNLGKYGCDWGAIETNEELREARQSHINIQSPIFNSDYLFTRYTLENTTPRTEVYDVYSLADGELVYRRRLPLEGKYGVCQFYEGIPVELDGETVYSWPLSFVQDGCFFVIVASDEMARIKDTDEINPTIVKIRIND